MSGVQSINQHQYKNLNIRFREKTEDEKVLADSFDNDIFYQELPYLKVSDKPVIVDVGAHIGTFSMFSSMKYPASKIFAFEASRDTFSLLDTNVRENKLIPQVKVFHNALCSIDQPVTLYHNLVDGNWGHTISKEISASSEVVDGLAFSTFVSKEQIREIDLIKFNCEGAEFDILINSPDTLLAKIKCAVILYHEDLAPSSYTTQQLVNKLAGAGLVSVFLNQSPNRGWIIAVNRKYYFPFFFKLCLRLRQKFRAWKKQ
ncbi:FkbM family methyltransferase [Pseudochryseolinea flava]|nr:FkbM family methyltransferase [Pseudochryseolinea flava]